MEYSVFFPELFYFEAIQAQETVPATGGNATGSGGSVSYSAGQVLYHVNSGINATKIQGVQQPYEISTVTTVENTGAINTEYLVFPNPTRRHIKLVIETKDLENLRFQLYDLNGTLIQDKNIKSEETEIIMESLPS